MDEIDIDDLLHNQGQYKESSTPNPIEQEKNEDAYGNEIEEVATPEEDYEHEAASEEPKEQLDEEEKPNDSDEDEYGNKKERMSKGMKERLDRKEKAHQREIEQREREIDALRAQLAQKGVSREVQQAVKDFEYDTNEGGDWEKQLASFVKQTVSQMTQEQARAQSLAQEQKNHAEFAKKFRQGMNRFQDFEEVVAAQPIDDAMTLALRGMDDPSSFIYAAAKRQPEELSRISRLPDPYARMVEMGKLEERMRKGKSATQAPRPITRPKEDVTPRIQPKAKPEPEIEDLIAQSDAKRLATLKARRAR